MMLKPSPRGEVARLPKWTQDYIKSLVTLLDRQEAEINKLSSQHPGSNLMLDGMMGYPAVSLPPDSTVQFYLGGSREDHADLIEIHHNHDGLEVTAYGGQLLVLPRVSNGVALQVSRRVMLS